jgi:high frequency lysogenization protein
MNPDHRHRAIALAALLQCCAQVRQIAESGQPDIAQTDILLRSLFKMDTPSYEDVYGNLANLRPGLIHLLDFFSGGRSVRDAAMTHCVVNLIYLQSRLAKQPQRGKEMLSQLNEAKNQLDYFSDIQHTSVVSRLAETYQTFISPLGQKIMVKGDPRHLENSHNASLIRALLLAGIRATVLWQQAGGSRFKLLWQRKGILRAAEQILQEIHPH